MRTFTFVDLFSGAGGFTEGMLMARSEKSRFRLLAASDINKSAELTHVNRFPLVTVNSKIRVSQGEFFDWFGREQLMRKGNPHCLSVQVALRKEMDMSIVQAAQAGDKFFLLGQGGERNVVPNRSELLRFSHSISEHLKERISGWSASSTQV